jgi:hypothetical protein
MLRYISIIGILFVYTNCGQTAIAQNELSLLIFPDSILAYNGKPGDKVPFRKFPAEKTELLSLFEKNKRLYGGNLVVLLKASNGAALSNIEQISNWLKEANINNFSISDPDPYDAKIFGARGALWNLTGAAKSVPTGDDAYTLIIIRDSLYAYRSANMSDFKQFRISGGAFHKYLSSIVAATDPDKLIFLLKPTQASSYKDIVDILDEMTITHVNLYTIVKLTPEEESFFHQTSHGGDKPSPSEPVDISASVRDIKPYLLFDLKPKGLFYQYVDTGNTVSNSIPVEPFTTANVVTTLNKIEKQYSVNLRKVRVAIKGDPDTGFKRFNLLMEGLKQKEIFKYDLLTEN